MASFRHRTSLALTLALGLLALPSLAVLARGSGRSSGYTPLSSSRGRHRSAVTGSRSTIKCESCPRDSHGKSTRDSKAVDEFSRRIPNHPGIAHAPWAISAY